MDTRTIYIVTSFFGYTDDTLAMNTVYDDKLYKFYSHKNAEKNGFITGLISHGAGLCSAKSNFPGVALYTSDIESNYTSRCIGAFVMIIPADSTVVYSEFTLVKTENVTLKIVSTDTSKETPVRFLLGNFFSNDTLFQVSCGKNKLINLIVPAMSYCKIPGTQDGHELVLSDTGISANSKQMLAASEHTITISRSTDDPSACIGTFDRNDKSITLLDTRKIKFAIENKLEIDEVDGSGKTTGAGAEYKARDWSLPGDLQADGPGAGKKGGGDSAGLGEEATDGLGHGLQKLAISDRLNAVGVDENNLTNCVSVITDKTVECKTYQKSYFNLAASYSIDVYFGKAEYRPATFDPELVFLPGGERFVCPCGKVHRRLQDAVLTVENMDCDCVTTDAKKYICVKKIVTMLL